MNRGELRTEVRDIVGEVERSDGDGDFWKNAELNRHIDEAQRRFLNEERWPWLLSEGSGSLVAEDPDLELVEGVAATRHLNITLTRVDWDRLYQPKRVSPAQGFQLKNEYASGVGNEPEFFYVTSVQSPAGPGDGYIYVVKFVPAPVQDMDVSYQFYRSGVPMDADDSEPDMPEDYHQGVAHYAAGLAWLKELVGGERKAQEQFEMYAGVVSQARGEWFGAPEDSIVVMGADPTKAHRGDPWLRLIPETLGP